MIPGGTVRDADSAAPSARQILYLQYTNPAGYPPLEHSSRILADGGWQVRFFGIEAEGSAQFLRLAEHQNIEIRMLKRQPPGVVQKIHYVTFGLRAFWVALMWRPLWIYASDPLICPIALVLSYLRGVKVIYHEHDSPASTGLRESFKKRLFLSLRKGLSRRARLNLLPSEGRVSGFRCSTGMTRRIFCVLNTPDRAEAARPRRRRNNIVRRIFYHGSIVPNRLPLTVIDAMAESSSFRFELMFAGYETNGHPHYVRQMEIRAAELQLSEQLHHLGPIPMRKALLEQARQADVGIALMPTQTKDINEETMAGASNKAFDYLACGLALLVSDLPDWNEMFVAQGYALACDPTDPASIARALRWFAENPEEARDMGERGRQRILKDWNYQRQFAPVLAELERSDPSGMTL